MVVVVAVLHEDCYVVQLVGTPVVLSPGIRSRISVPSDIKVSRQALVMRSGRNGEGGFSLWMMGRRSWKAQIDPHLFLDQFAFRPTSQRLKWD